MGSYALPATFNSYMNTNFAFHAITLVLIEINQIIRTLISGLLAVPILISPSPAKDRRIASDGYNVWRLSSGMLHCVGRSLPTFQRCLLPPSSGRWVTHVTQVCSSESYLPTSPHGTTTQKTIDNANHSVPFFNICCFLCWPLIGYILNSSFRWAQIWLNTDTILLCYNIHKTWDDETLYHSVQVTKFHISTSHSNGWFRSMSDTVHLKLSSLKTEKAVTVLLKY
jgi:hypothetical protein